MEIDCLMVYISIHVFYCYPIAFNLHCPQKICLLLLQIFLTFSVCDSAQPLPEAVEHPCQHC